MKATELQLNDLVQYKGDVCHITSLDALGGLVGIVNECLIELVSESEIQPIPITAELLEKNGMGYERDYGAFYRSMLGSYQRPLDPIINIGWDPNGEIYDWEVSNGKRVAMGKGELKYIHQLQHALRLCGLNDLADKTQI